jgi:hypothetical protein
MSSSSLTSLPVGHDLGMDDNEVWRRLQNCMAFCESMEDQTMQFIKEHQSALERIHRDGPSEAADLELMRKATGLCMALQKIRAARDIYNDLLKETQ